MAANWTPPTGYPNGAGDTATFDVSNTTAVSLSAYVQVDGIIFNSGASAFTITAGPTFTLTISGTGITNNSGITQNFVADVVLSGSYGGQINFTNNATAGSSTMFTANGAFGSDFSNPGYYGGTIGFYNTASASNGTFIDNGSGAYGYYGGFIDFHDTSTAGNGTFTANGAAFQGYGGFIEFYDSSSASNGTFTANGPVGGQRGGFIVFYGSSTADNAILIANSGRFEGGNIFFYQTSTGGTSRVEVFGDGSFFGSGSLEISGHDAPGVTIGSLEGTGYVSLGANNLTVGSNNLSTTFSGTIQDSGSNGSLTKIGTGTLTLSGANSYTGGTTVNAGKLLVNNTTGSGTGSGAVAVSNSGTTLGGGGTINGALTVNSGAVLLGGKGTTPNGVLTVANNLTLSSGSIIELVLGASGAHSTLSGAGGTWTFPSNQAFTFINSGAQPGVYDNIITGLAADPGTEGSWTITNPGFTGTFSYDGAGNIDLTLTAVHPQVTAAVSRKLHTGVGTFPLNLPLDGTLGVECRKGGAAGDYQIVISFTNNVGVNGNPQAAVTSGQGQVGTGGTSNGGVVTVSGADVTVPLTNVTNAQTITVTLFGVNDGTNSGDIEIPMNVLIGDVNASGRTDAGDVTAVRNHTVSIPNEQTFQFDVNASGRIDAGDVTATRNATVTVLP